MAAGKSFSGKVKVASTIVDYLSSGLYESPAACMKELINNSYDADASRVDIHVKPDADRIIVSDDGSGMNQKEFQDHFDHVSESHKRDSGDRTQKKRLKVGKIGIGFIAANELCEVMEIASTKRGSTDLLKVIVDFKKMRDPLKQRRDKSGAVTKADYHGTIDKASSSEHYTRVYLNEVRDNVRDVMAGADPTANTAGKESLYGLGPDLIAKRLADPERRAWTDLNLYSQTMLEVGLNVPVQYAPNWIPSSLEKKLRGFEEEVKELGFTVKWDGTDVRKPIVLGYDRYKLPHVLHSFSYKGDRVAARGYFFAQHGIILPQELNGLLIRIRSAAVGDYDPGFLGHRASEYQLIKRWVSGEVWASDELEEALNIDRKTLRSTVPAFVEFQAAIHKELGGFLRDARQKLYEVPSSERQTERANIQVEELEAIAARYKLPSPISKPAQKATSGSDAPPQQSTRGMSRKYTASQLYDIALQVAEEELPRELFNKFAKALAKRITR